MIRDERNDIELLRGTLEVLVAALGGQSTDASVTLKSGPPAGAINADSFSQDNRTTSLLLSLLEEEDFYIRYFTTQLLNALGVHHAHRLQEVILSNPTVRPDLRYSSYRTAI